jgi:hypothetical protein
MAAGAGITAGTIPTGTTTTGVTTVITITAITAVITMCGTAVTGAAAIMETDSQGAVPAVKT